MIEIPNVNIVILWDIKVSCENPIFKLLKQ